MRYIMRLSGTIQLKSKEMSIQVNVFNEQKAKDELKNCPKIVQDYLKLLEEHNEREVALTKKAISNLRLAGAQLSETKQELEEVKNKAKWVLDEYIKCVNDRDDITEKLQEIID